MIGLLAGVSAAAAADSAMMKSGQGPLNLTSAQRQDIYRVVSKQNASETEPASFTAWVGEVVPSSVTLHALPASAAKQVPAVKSYDYAMLGKDILIVNPSTKKIADVIEE
jgi:hypothetical protein